MSALNVTQAEADLLLASLNMYATVHVNASGVMPADVEALLAKLAPTPAPVVEEVVAETPPDVVEPTPEEVEAHFAAEEVVEETSTRKKKAK
jgi:hypothetical protein